MCSALPKVLHSLAGFPLLTHVLQAVGGLAPERTHVVYGHGGRSIREHFAESDVNWVLQDPQLGTGHAVQQALGEIDDASTVVVAYGDMPLIRPRTLIDLRDSGARGLTVATATLAKPDGYGRILRSTDGRLRRIVEETDASSEQIGIREVNTGFMAASAGTFRRYLQQVQNRNQQGEFYLTDIVHIAVARGDPVFTQTVDDPDEVRGVNSRSDLAAVERLWQRRNAERLMGQGATILDPDRIDVRGELIVGRDCVFDVNVIFEGNVVVGDGAHVGANTIVRRSTIGIDAVIASHCVIEDAEIASRARVGPFARIRPGTVIGEAAHVGNFVEIKNSRLEACSKANHLSYIGDANVGRNVNIGAGVITCNYDGANKHRTEIADDVFIGSNSQLVAPVRIGSGATIGAGSTITADVPDRVLAVSRARQRHITGWQRPRKDKD